MVFQRSMLDWRRGGGVNLQWVYMKHIWCNGFPEIYAQLEEGRGVNLQWVYVHCAISAKFGVTVFKESMFYWRRWWDQSAMDIYALCYM